jgi:hypothetical protein
MKTTGNERRLLAAYNQPGQYVRTPGNLVAAGKLPAGSSLEGLHQTAASLVRKGLLERRVLGRRVHYEITPAGREAARAWA